MKTEEIIIIIKIKTLYAKCFEHKPVKCILSNLKTKNSLQGNEGFQIHMQFPLSKSSVDIIDLCTN